MSQININNEPSAEVIIDENGTPVTVIIATSGASGAVWGSITGTLSDQTDLQNALDAKVPYSGATGNVNLGEYGLTSGYVQFDITPTTYTPAVGNLGYNDTVGTLETTLKGGTVQLRIGRDMFERVVNKTGVQLTKAAYQAVRVSDAQGQRLAVALAQANNDNNSADTIGLVIETIDVNQEGNIFTVGEITGINTTGSLQGETWADGDVLYLSPTVAGRVSNVKPVAPQHLVIIGYVVYAHANNGKIYVKIMNGWELGELHDVNTTGATAGQVLKYNGTIWAPSADAGVTGSGIAGQVAYWNSSSTITSNFGLSFSDSVGRLGINTFFPNYRVNALGTASTNNGFVASETLGREIGIFSSRSTTGEAALSVLSNNALTFETVGTERARLTTTGNLLLGSTTDAGQRLQVTGLSSFTGTTASDGGQLGSELLSASGWTSTGWTGSFEAGYTHTVGNTSVLSNALTATSSLVYQIQYTITGRTAGTISIAFGGQTFTNISATGTQYRRTTTSGNLQITPTSDFDGTIIISIRLVSASSANIELRNSSGTLVNEIRTSNSNTNTFIGVNAGSRTLTSTNNVGIGFNALSLNVIGTDNVAIGTNALSRATPTYQTVAIGSSALQNFNGTAFGIAIGWGSAANNLSGGQNVMIGDRAGNSSTTSSFNTIIGYEAGFSFTTIGSLTLYGNNAARNITTGGSVTVIGTGGAQQYSGGTTSATSFSNGVYVGRNTKVGAAGATNELVLGDSAEGLGSNTTVIGNSSTTFGRWWGNLLVGTSTNSGFALDVNGTARIQNDLTISDTRNIILATGTGTKIGTATSQKLAFWNATPIVQPTTGIAEATFVENSGGTAVNVDSTFAGYTLQQIAQALKNIGILA